MATIKPTIFSVVDVETCRPAKGDKSGMVFDVAWRHIDRKGNVYGNGSYLVSDVLSRFTPFYREKVGKYFAHAYNRKVHPLPFINISAIFNDEIEEFINNGHRVVFCAYNAGFDCRALGYTARVMFAKPFLRVPVEIMCIWEYWARSCPMTYFAERTASGKYLKTNAESVFAFEFQKPDFIEDHVGHSDVEAECDILLKVLARKKKMPVVSNPNQLAGGVYHLANERLGIV